MIDERKTDVELLRLAKQFVDEVNARPREWAKVTIATSDQVVVDCGRHKLSGMPERAIQTRIFRRYKSGQIVQQDYFHA